MTVNFYTVMITYVFLRYNYFPASFIDCKVFMSNHHDKKNNWRKTHTINIIQKPRSKNTSSIHSQPEHTDITFKVKHVSTQDIVTHLNLR